MQMISKKDIQIICSIVVLTIVSTCKPQQAVQQEISLYTADSVVADAIFSWESYKKYAFGHDIYRPLTRDYSDWYEEPLYISLIDAYSTLKIMGLESYCDEIEVFLTDSIDYDKDIYVKVFEVNIRILGGLLSMYHLSGNTKVLEKAEDFAKRLLPAFDTPTGIPRYFVNLKTGYSYGDTVNAAEGGSYLVEMAVLTYFTKNPVYYKSAKKATLAFFERRSGIDLIGESIDVSTGNWITKQSHMGCCMDSYFEYLYKAYLLTGDPDLKNIWGTMLPSIYEYQKDETDSTLYFCQVDMNTGKKLNSMITLWDAYLPALLALSGDIQTAEKLQMTWYNTWKKWDMLPFTYDYEMDEVRNPTFDLNPEFIESAYYLYYLTNEESYLQMVNDVYADIKTYCRTGSGYTQISDVTTKEQGNEMASFFIAETLKYLYLTYNIGDSVNIRDYVFSTEAHPFRLEDSSTEEIRRLFY